MGAFLEESDDISLEEMKNRQNAVLTSITCSAASKDSLKGAVGGHEFRGLHHRGPEFIEAAAEQDFLCDCSLLLPGAACKNSLCSSSRDRTHNGERAAPRSSPSSSSTSSLPSPISNLMVEFERMSLQEPAESPRSCRQRRSSGGSRRREAAELSRGLSRLSVGGPDCRTGEGPSWGSEVGGGGTGEERRSSSSDSSEEFFEAEEGPEAPGRTRGSAPCGRSACARSKSWDHGGRDLSSSASSGSSGSSYKSLDNANQFLPRTPPPQPHVRRGVFIQG